MYLFQEEPSFAGDSHWVYTCSCDVAGTELIECCGQQMEVIFAGLAQFQANEKFADLIV